MDFKDKRVLVMGIGVSGLSAIKALNKYGAKIIVTDSKNEMDLKDILDSIKYISFEKILGDKEVDLSKIELIVKSPGIPPNSKILIEAKELGIKVINDIELGYILSSTRNIIGITGTNGKTTTTTLIGKILKNANLNPHIAGNIGRGFLEEVINSKKNDYFVLELSSFQLEDIDIFNPRVALILNISPDHLNWHGNYENYIKSKKKIFKNQSSEDYIVLNYDDPIVRSFEEEINSNILWFSLNTYLEKGIYLKSNNIIYNDGIEETIILNCKDLKIIGRHNLENILGALAISIILGVDTKTIKDTLEKFKGVEHRLEFVDEIRHIKFFNDSKGTNPNASIKAIEAIDGDIILIAGGYEKKSNFNELINFIKSKVKYLILLGDTKYRIRDTAFKHDYKSVKIVNNMKEAVQLSYNLAKEKDTILLSPACASWDMYKNFEDRGRDFKRLVYTLGDGHIEQK